MTQPIAYFVLPIECEKADAGCLDPILTSAFTPLTASFTWWLPPWIVGDRTTLSNDVNTYVINLDGSLEEFLKHKVRKRFLEYVRASHRRGIEIIERPDLDEIDEYLALYERTYLDRNWLGDKFSKHFFLGVANTLGDAGYLVLLRYAGRIVGGGVVLIDSYAVHYFQGVTDRDVSEVKPHMVLYDWLLKTASARGLSYVNLGGVNHGNESLIEFKQGWGALPTPIPIVRWSFQYRAPMSSFKSWLRLGSPKREIDGAD